jgi:hypothetical protein
MNSASRGTFSVSFFSFRKSPNTPTNILNGSPATTHKSPTTNTLNDSPAITHNTPPTNILNDFPAITYTGFAQKLTFAQNIEKNY